MATPSRRGRAAPRRIPRRRSGKQIVDAIIEGATRILGCEGYDRLTTNRIAEMAGVSIGSLYQYFPGKHAVIAAIAKQLEARALEILVSTFTSRENLDFRDRTRVLITRLASDRLGDLNMRREVLNHVPRAWITEASQAVDDQVHALLVAYLHQHTSIRKKHPKLSIFIVMHAVEAVLEAAVARQPELLRDPAFHEELAQLVIGYLDHSEAPAETPRPQSPRHWNRRADRDAAPLSA